MDLEAIRMMRETRSFIRTVNVDVTSGQILRKDPSRISFVIFAPPTNRFTIFPRRAAVLDTGFTFYAAGQPFTFSLMEHGEIIVDDWNAITVVLAQDVVIVETCLVKA